MQMEFYECDKNVYLNHSNKYKSTQESILCDSGFDSILTRDDTRSSFNTSSSTSPIAYTPKKTPLKRSCVDLDGIYYACIKSPYKSPQNYLQNGSYINERDTAKTNLMRSPIVDLQQNYVPVTPNRIIKCKKFITSTQEDEIITPIKQKPFTTPTQDEFIDILIKHHLPSNPDCLIGRHMGVEQIDYLNELNKRSMNNVIDLIMQNLKPPDFANMYRVSKTWKHVIQYDKKRNRERMKFVKYKKDYILATKENIMRNDCCEIAGILQPLKKCKRLSNGAFTKLDINRLNNSSVSSSSLISDFYQMDIDCDKSSNFDSKSSNLLKINESVMKPMNKKSSYITQMDYTISPGLPTKLNDDTHNKFRKMQSATKICSLKSKKNLRRL